MPAAIRFFPLATVLAATLPAPLAAFPPAPGLVVHGLVRNTDGWPLEGAGAKIVFLSGENVLATATLDTERVTGDNYRTLLPIDMKSSSGAYRPGVVEENLPFTVQVKIGDQTFVPIESAIGVDAPTSAAAGSLLQLDFTLGTDSDGDGIPDEWEYRQLEGAGISRGSAGYTLGRFSRDGDFDRDGLADYGEYLAGTYAYLGSDNIDLNAVGISEDEWLEFEFLAIIDKAYSFEGSDDLQTWLPASVTLDGDRLSFRTAFQATNTRIIRVSIPPDSSASTRLFRARVR